MDEIKHTAGPLVNGLQVCTGCGLVLADYRGSHILDGAGDFKLGWGIGCHVFVRGPGMTAVAMTDDPTDCRAVK